MEVCLTSFAITFRKGVDMWKTPYKNVIKHIKSH